MIQSRCLSCGGDYILGHQGWSCTCGASGSGDGAGHKCYDFDKSYRQLCEKEIEIHDKKKAAYTGGGDPLANYQAAADFAGIHVALVMLSRMQEKMYRLKLVAEGAVSNDGDTVEDACLDISVIAKLLAIELSQT